MSSQIIYPPVGFYFQLKAEHDINGAETIAFKEVSGLSTEISTEEIVEGGQNQFVHRLPNAPKYIDLVLKRGMASKQSALMLWITDTLQSEHTEAIVPKALEVSLLDAEGKKAMSWNFVNAYPIALRSAPIDTMSNDVAIESLTLSYSHFKRALLTKLKDESS